MPLGTHESRHQGVTGNPDLAFIFCLLSFISAFSFFSLIVKQSFQVSHSNGRKWLLPTSQSATTLSLAVRPDSGFPRKELQELMGSAWEAMAMSSSERKGERGWAINSKLIGF